MSQKIRTFVAVEIDLNLGSGIEELMRQFRSSSMDVKWVEPENRHLTLKFLGDVDLNETYDVCRAVERAVEGIEPFDMELRGIGAFPNAKRPRTLWVGAGEGADEMIGLAERVESQMERLGYRREPRRFQPHLTLGRLHGGPAPAEIVQLLEQHADLEIGSMPVDEVIIFSSTLTKRGPVYDPLGRAKLR
jgi:2'-5' RNA ligase